MPLNLDMRSDAPGGEPPVRGAVLRLASRPSAPGRGRRSVRDILDWAPAETIDAVELLVSELLTNSVVHAGLGGNETVDLRLTCAQGSVRVEVADLGHRIRAGAELVPGSSGGWGFYLVSKLADRWGVDEFDEGKSVWFEIDL